MIENRYTPFQLEQYHNNSIFDILIGGLWHVNHSKSGNGNYYLIKKSRVMTNLQDWSASSSFANNKEYIKLSATSLYDIAKVIKDRTTGLNVMVTPEFFYKNDTDKWTHAGALDKVRLVGFRGLKNLQELYMGGRKIYSF